MVLAILAFLVAVSALALGLWLDSALGFAWLCVGFTLRGLLRAIMERVWPEER
jgi:hypothetical protein